MQSADVWARIPSVLVRPRRKPRGSLKSFLLGNAKKRARRAGLETTIWVEDIFWPTHCPVLGLELDYATPRGQRKVGPNLPSLDRHDNTKGYIPGNVFVISYRANSLKSNATAAELLAVAEYAAHGPR